MGLLAQRRRSSVDTQRCVSADCYFAASVPKSWKGQAAFAGMTALAWEMIYFIAIETKMKSFEEIEAIVDAAEGL